MFYKQPLKFWFKVQKKLYITTEPPECPVIFIYFRSDKFGKAATIGSLHKLNIAFKYCPVYEFFTFATSRGVPAAITFPPSAPPSGPKSII